MFRIRPPERTNVVDIYDDHAKHWWDFSNPIFEPLHAMVPARARYLDRQGLHVDGRVVVDVGAGGGYVTKLLAGRGAKVAALDIARQALLAGATEVPRASFVEASAAVLPFADASVDMVVNTDVLVHLPGKLQEECVREMARILKPDGVLWFSTINSTWLARTVLITLGEDLLRFVHKGTHEPSTFISPKRMRALLAAVGMTLVHQEGLGPVRLNARARLVMGRLPTTSVMWQGHARKTA